MENEHKISILGSTGSIGTQTLEVVRAYPNFKVMAMSANSNIELLEKQAREFLPELVCVVNEEKANELKIKLSDTDIKVVSGKDGLVEVATYKDVKTVV